MFNVIQQNEIIALSETTGPATLHELLEYASVQRITAIQTTASYSQVVGLPKDCVYTILIMRWSQNWINAIAIPITIDTNAKCYRAAKAGADSWRDWMEI